MPPTSALLRPAAAVGLFVSVFNGFGRLLTGIAVDRFGWKATMFGINGVLIAPAC